MEELRIKPIFNSSYSPNFNPVEGAIGVVKSGIKKKRLNNIMNGK